MAESPVEICNLALAHLGVSKPIASLSERSAEAYAMNLFYLTAVKATFRNMRPPFATDFADLSELSNSSDTGHPTTEWDRVYTYPTLGDSAASVLTVTRILSGDRNDNRQTRASYRIVTNASGKRIYCDEPEAVAELIVYREDVESYPEDFVLALSRHLASLTAPLITKGDPWKREEANMKLYLMAIAAAGSNAFNEEQPDEEVESEFIRGR